MPRYEYYRDTTPYSDNQFLMENWMHCVMDTSGEPNLCYARCTTEARARQLVNLLNQEEKKNAA